jgi:hypothetical protein
MTAKETKEYLENTLGKRILKAMYDTKRVSQVTLYFKNKDKYDNVGLSGKVTITDGMVVKEDDYTHHEYPLNEISDFGYTKRR